MIGVAFLNEFVFLALGFFTGWKIARKLEKILAYIKGWKK